MSSPAAPGLFQPLMAFLEWWGRELVGMAPGARSGGGRSRQRTIALVVEGETLRLIDQRPRAAAKLVRTATGDGAGTADLTKALRQLAKSARRAKFGVRLPLAAGLERTMVLPRAAKTRAGDILMYELERSTPIKADHVYTAHYLDEAAGSGTSQTAHHIIFKRETVDRAVETLAALGVTATFVDAYREQPETPLPVDLLAAARGDAAGPAPRRQFGLGLAFAALLLGVLAAYQLLAAQEQTLAGIKAQTTEVQVKALKVRKRVDASEASLAGRYALIRRRSETPSTLQLLEEVTRRLPDTAWISEFRIDQGKLEIGGFAASAAGLVQVVEQSPLFEGVSLSSPVVLDPRYDAEHFSIVSTITGAAGDLHEPGPAGPAP